VDTVKIDRSFVSQVSTSAHHRVLIEATVNVAQSLGMNTVAEGIETEDQAAMVTQLGCNKGQGYLFSRPLPEAELLAWLAAHATKDTQATPQS
jgi:EAL domain-containing protein (putative c-di-GMP-specific phosphodiesterase class I)